MEDSVELRRYERGIFAHAPSEVIFSGLRGWATVSGCAGLADWADCGTAASHGCDKTSARESHRGAILEDDQNGTSPRIDDQN
eukprot:SAG11_NODE_4248_length_1987_cov_1.788136_3_plen_83_part_00